MIDFVAGLKIEDSTSLRSRRFFLALSIISNLSFLGFFKYFSFFSDTAIQVLTGFGLAADSMTLNIILPIGISFYTFQTLSYSIDIYLGRMKATRNFFDFALFVAFFPQLVAGPIERASTLLPQITSPRLLKADQINAGMFLILWGYFKKMAIADNLGEVVTSVFNNYTDYQGLDIVIATLAFTIQIYGDFSGYSDIARGLSKLMGFELMLNFNLPYFATNPSDFWKRWHISLSTWFRDYVYIPLGGNRTGSLATYRNLAITMILCGLWHGAAWNFIVWGVFHGLLLVVYRLMKARFSYVLKWLNVSSTMTSTIGIIVMFLLTNIGWIIFRSSSIQQAVYMVTHLGFASSTETLDFVYDLLFFSFPLLIVQIWQFRTQDLLIPTKLIAWSRVPLYAAMLALIIVFGERDLSEFIYFQF